MSNGTIIMRLNDINQEINVKALTYRLTFFAA